MDKEFFLCRIGRRSASGVRIPVWWEMETAARNYIDIYHIRGEMTGGQVER
jgi:hypothetical protein